jgi:hypothetical protein
MLPVGDVFVPLVEDVVPVFPVFDVAVFDVVLVVVPLLLLPLHPAATVLATTSAPIKPPATANVAPVILAILLTNYHAACVGSSFLVVNIFYELITQLCFMDMAAPTPTCYLCSVAALQAFACVCCVRCVRCRNANLRPQYATRRTELTRTRMRKAFRWTTSGKGSLRKQSAPGGANAAQTAKA